MMDFWSWFFRDRRTGLTPMIAPVTPSTLPDEVRDQRRLVLQYASEFRRFEIEHFWQRSLFFWGPLILAFGGYATVFDKAPKGALAIACFGTVCSVIWTLQNRGNKYWQEAWESKVQLMERDVLGTNLFSNKEPPQPSAWLSSRRYSPSRLAIILSDFTLATFVGLIGVSFHRAGLTISEGAIEWQVCGALAGTVAFSLAAWRWGRSET